MDLQSLRLFVAIMETGSITRAAQRENIAISAVSKRLGLLEARIGSKLFMRHPNGLEPTPAAAVLLRNARTVLRNLAQMQLEMAEFSEGVRGTVSIAASIAIASNYLPDELRSFSLSHPGVTISVHDALSRQAVEMVKDGAADLGIFAEPYSAGDLPTVAYKTEQLVAVLPAGHPLSTRRALTLAEMVSYDFVLGRPGSSLTTLIERAAAAAGSLPRFRVQVSGSEAIARMVEAGLGVSILPAAMARPRRTAGMVLRPLREPWASRRLRLCFPPGEATTPARLLVEHLSAAHRAEPS
ncbi:LysR family transcriptional regulator [Sabulicella rubraurantiaca]|uniref:LysR family transcriptional regulator n=1 Tax=Sabulicella rubraurantiaca TaxID=2811429 RepID=UPI001A972967|nr:LysR family transcriptional regulator [Sabulicella rubraurantiaca]